MERTTLEHQPFWRFAAVALADAVARRQRAVATPGSPVDAVLAELAGGVDFESSAATESSAAVRRALAADLDGTSVLASIARRCRLSAAEVEVLAVAAAVELDSRLSRLLDHLLDGGGDGRLTLGALLTLLGPDHPGATTLAPGTALRCAALVDLAGGGALANRSVAVAPVTAWALLGVADEATALAGLPTSTRVVQLDGDGGSSLLLVHGGDRTRRLQVAVEELAAPSALVVPAPEDEPGWAALVAAASTHGHGIVVELPEGNELDDRARRWIERTPHLAWAIGTTHALPLWALPRRSWTERVAGPAAVEAGEVDAVLGAANDLGGHRLSAEQLVLVARAVDHLQGDARRAIRRLAGGDLDRVATRVTVRRGWADLVLPAHEAARVREVAERYRHRETVYGTWGFRPSPSPGVLALFAGPPGTGKTLSGEVIAGELGMDLFRIDLAGMVSKYIGETEKNLERLFQAAEGSSVVLIFDEADAVFGKRSEVSDAKDRYANIETSYLLQRLESHEGLVILTTNFANNIDQAFQRRIAVSVEFAPPEAPERRRLWAGGFPATAPTEALDLDFLAEAFRLTGAQIHSAALGAAFRAAGELRPITMDDVVLAVREEFRKQGRIVPPAEFGPYAGLVAADAIAGDDAAGPTEAAALTGRRRGVRAG